jgi:hypothetical protein
LPAHPNRPAIWSYVHLFKIQAAAAGAREELVGTDSARVLCEKANWKYGKQNRAIFEQARPQQKQALVDTRHEAQQRA